MNTPATQNYSPRALVVDLVLAVIFTFLLPFAYAYGSKGTLAFTAFMLGLCISAALRGLVR